MIVTVVGAVAVVVTVVAAAVGAVEVGCSGSRRGSRSRL